MANGDTPLLVTLRDQIAEEIGTIDKDAEGYHFNYAPLRLNAYATPQRPRDPWRPEGCLSWAGGLQVPTDPEGGFEGGYRRVIRSDGFALSFPVFAPNGDHEGMAWRIEHDVQGRLLDPTRRRLGHGGSTFRGWPLLSYLPATWDPEFFGEVGEGGLLIVNLGLRHQHQLADMSTGG